MTKAEILNDIDFNLGKAFDALNAIFLHKNSEYNKLYEEFTYRKDNFDERDYKLRLKCFVNLNNCHFDKQTPNKDTVDDDYYGLIMDLVFQKQTKHFSKIYKYKTVGTFLLHGETDEEENELRLACRHILYVNKLLLGNLPLKICFTTKTEATAQKIADELFAKFYIDKNEENSLQQLRSEIQDYIKTQSLIVLIHYPNSVLSNEKEMKELFENFLPYLNKEIVRKKGNYNSLIFIFNVNGIASCVQEQYFFWYNQNLDNYVSKVKNSKEIKIVDLAPIEDISEKNISEWIENQMEYPQRYTKINHYENGEDKLLCNGRKPFQVICKLCNDFQINIQTEWRIQY